MTAATERLHPAAIAIWSFTSLRFIVILLVPGLLSGRARALLVPIVVIALEIASSVLRFARFRFEVTPDALIVEGGVLSRWRKVIPRARMQSIDLVQRLRHQMFGVVEVRVEVIGSSTTEAALVALKPADAERVRAALLEQQVSTSTGPEEPPPLAKMSVGELLLAGITGGRVAVFGALIGYVDNVLPDEFSPTSVIPEGISLAVVAVAVVVVVGLVAIAASIVATVLTYWDFTVRRDGDRLVITRGLLDKRRAVVPLRRVQAVYINENVVRRLLGLASLTVTIAGYAGDSSDVEESSMVLPVAGRERAFALAAAILSDPFDIAGAPLEPAPERARTRRLVRATVVGGIVGATGTLLAPPYGALALMALPLGWIIALDAWRALGHWVDERYAVVRSGSLVRRTSVVPLANIQVLALQASPLQRSRRLATLHLRVPRASVQVLDLDRARAEERFVALEAAMAPSRIA